MPDVSPTTVALALLLVVLGAATLARLRIAIVASVVAMLTLNFFFLPPVGTFTIADPQNWIALVRVPDGRGHRQQSVGGRTGSSARGDRAPQRVDAAVRSDARRAADDRNRECHRRARPARRPTLRSARASRSACQANHGWRIHQGGNEEVAIDASMLNTALAKARGTLEFDAHQRAYGGHMRVGENNDSLARAAAARHTGGRPARGAAPSLDIGTLDAVAGVVAIAIERAAVPGRTRRGGTVRNRRPTSPPRCWRRSATT